MLQVQMDARGLVRLVRNLTLFIAELNNRDEVLREIKEEQNERWVQNFTSEGMEYDPWQPTSQSYQDVRSREGFSPRPTLRRSGRTFMHFVQQNDAANITGQGITWEFTNNMVDAFTVSHHRGYRLGRSMVPARTLWKIDDKDVQRAVNKFDTWLDALAVKYLG